jgi:rhodanese-related sulfurtransferase
MSIMQFMLAHPYLFGALGIVLILIMVMEVQRARRMGGGVDAATAVRLINREDAWVLDVRDVAAFKQGHIIEARNIPEARLDESLSSLESQKERPVIVCCEEGNRAASVVERLARAGFSRSLLLRGGLRAWREAELPLEKR